MAAAPAAAEGCRGEGEGAWLAPRRNASYVCLSDFIRVSAVAASSKAELTLEGKNNQYFIPKSQRRLLIPIKPHSITEGQCIIYNQETLFLMLSECKPKMCLNSKPSTSKKFGFLHGYQLLTKLAYTHCTELFNTLRGSLYATAQTHTFIFPTLFCVP